MSTSEERIANLVKAAKERRESGAPRAPKMNPVERAAANPTSAKKAIAAKCWECEGGDADPHINWRIGNCLCENTCPLYGHRPYKHLCGAATPVSLVFPREKVLAAR